MSPAADADDAIQRALDAVRDFGFGGGREWYAGHHIDQDASLILFRVPDETFDRHVQALVGDAFRLKLRDATHSRIELESVRDRVWDLPGSEDISGVSVPIDGSTLKVTLDGDVAAAQAWMNSMLPGLVSVSAMPPRAAGSALVGAVHHSVRGTTSTSRA